MAYELNSQVVNAVIAEIKPMIFSLLKDNVVKIILFGSCSRGDYRPDSDIDIAILTKTDRDENKKYTYDLAEISTEMAMKYLTVVNFICIPDDDFNRLKTYSLFMNIKKEGKEL